MAKVKTELIEKSQGKDGGLYQQSRFGVIFRSKATAKPVAPGCRWEGGTKGKRAQEIVIAPEV